MYLCIRICSSPTGTHNLSLFLSLFLITHTQHIHTAQALNTYTQPKHSTHTHSPSTQHIHAGQTGGEAIFAILSLASNLQALNIAQNDIGADGVEKLCAGIRIIEKNLVDLDVRNNNIGPPGAQMIGLLSTSCRNLTRLNMVGLDRYDDVFLYMCVCVCVCVCVCMYTYRLNIVGLNRYDDVFLSLSLSLDRYVVF